MVSPIFLLFEKLKDFSLKLKNCISFWKNKNMKWNDFDCSSMWCVLSYLIKMSRIKNETQHATFRLKMNPLLFYSCFFNSRSLYTTLLQLLGQIIIHCSFNCDLHKSFQKFSFNDFSFLNKSSLFKKKLLKKKFIFF